MIYAVHRLVDRMLYVKMEIASVYRNILVIHTKLVDQSVSSIRNVHATRPVWRINAKILALGRAVKMQYAMSWITFLCVLAYLDISGIRSLVVVFSLKVNVIKFYLFELVERQMIHVIKLLLSFFNSETFQSFESSNFQTSQILNLWIRYIFW